MRPRACGGDARARVVGAPPGRTGTWGRGAGQGVPRCLRPQTRGACRRRTQCKSRGPACFGIDPARMPCTRPPRRLRAWRRAAARAARDRAPQGERLAEQSCPGATVRDRAVSQDRSERVRSSQGGVKPYSAAVSALLLDESSFRRLHDFSVDLRTRNGTLLEGEGTFLASYDSKAC